MDVSRDDHLYLKQPGSKTNEWTKTQNDKTTQWFTKNTAVEKRSKELAEKSAKPAYRYIEEHRGLLYAGRVANDGEMSAAILTLDFNELEIIRPGDIGVEIVQIYAISPSPLDTNLVALFVTRSGFAHPSLIVMNKNDKSIMRIFEGVYSYKWAKHQNILYCSSIEENPACPDSKQHIVYGYNCGTQINNKIYATTEPLVYILLDTADDTDLFIHECLSYSAIRLKHINTGTLLVTCISHDDSANNHYVGKIGRTVYVFTNSKAPNGMLIAYKETAGYSSYTTVIAEEKRPLQSVGIAETQIFCIYVHGGVSEVETYDSRGDKKATIDLPDRYGSIATYPEAPLQYQNGTLHYYLPFESFTCPPLVLRYRVDTQQVDTVYSERDLRHPSNCTVERHTITARDGTQLTAFSVRKAGVAATKDTPTIMYGYGGFGDIESPAYHNYYVGLDVADWVERGGQYVQCIIRGGGEYGSEWHKYGSREYKINSFNDFIDITEWLIESGLTSAERIAVCGGSNGGLLVCTLVTMRPDLYAAAVAMAPLANMVAFSNDERNSMYITEFGDPRNDEAMLAYLLSYSPYHNIHGGTSYPPLYIQVCEDDNNAPPYHGKQMIAKLQDVAEGTAQDKHLIRVLASGGHSTGKGEECFRTCAEMQTFMEYYICR